MTAFYHILLFSCWIFFGASHSIFAAATVKEKCRLFMKNKFRYYRVIYSLFAFIILASTLCLTFSMQSFLLWKIVLAQRIVAVLIGIAGICVMSICIKKYFFYLSGSSVFFGKEPEKIPLQINGINRYMRHPLYTGTLMLVWSIFLWHPVFSFLISAICITGYTIIGVTFEERKLVNTFGKAYTEYAAAVPMFFPRLTK